MSQGVEWSSDSDLLKYHFDRDPSKDSYQHLFICLDLCVYTFLDFHDIKHSQDLKPIMFLSMLNAVLMEL